MMQLLKSKNILRDKPFYYNLYGTCRKILFVIIIKKHTTHSHFLVFQTQWTSKTWYSPWELIITYDSITERTLAAISSSWNRKSRLWLIQTPTECSSSQHVWVSSTYPGVHTLKNILTTSACSSWTLKTSIVSLLILDKISVNHFAKFQILKYSLRQTIEDLAVKLKDYFKLWLKT